MQSADNAGAALSKSIPKLKGIGDALKKDQAGGDKPPFLNQGLKSQAVIQDPNYKKNIYSAMTCRVIK